MLLTLVCFVLVYYLHCLVVVVVILLGFWGCFQIAFLFEVLVFSLISCAFVIVVCCVGLGRW